MSNRNLDLQMLVCFEALVAERSVTRAAERMDMTQPGMSNVLSKLREAFGDPLLVRTSQGMVPTQRAVELAEHVREALRHIDEALSASKPFVPRTDALTVSIAASDYTNLSLLPVLAAHLGKEAPGIALVLYPLSPHLVREALIDGRFDMAIGFFADLPDDFHATTLLTDRMSCIASTSHPRIQHEVDLQQYARESHVTFGAGAHYASTVEAQTDAALKQHGVVRRMALSLPSIMALPSVVAASELVATFPMRGAQAQSKRLPIQVLEVPFLSYEFRISMIWHARTHRSQAHQWLRSAIRDISADALT